MSERRFEVKSLIAVYVTLMFLLLLTLGAAYVHLGFWGPWVNLGIAIVKAAFIVLVFMELAVTRGVVRVIAWVGVYWLAILIGFTLTDYLTRNWAYLPGK